MYSIILTKKITSQAIDQLSSQGDNHSHMIHVDLYHYVKILNFPWCKYKKTNQQNYRYLQNLLTNHQHHVTQIVEEQQEHQDLNHS